uniref:UNC93-like protein MFSD11 n=1 Tax=Meloidogyne enterolobii TaxID=390850 RepID=A0A6V7UYG5_MELEN|nr:unnamed protein product [Meloidogyne enterolobii]
MAINSQTLNVFQLGIGFFFVFLAFNSQGFIEESVLDSFVAQGVVKRHDGYTSLAIIYASFTLLNIAAAPIVGILGTRWALLFGACTYALFQAGFLFLNRFYLFGSSALLGLGAAVIWTAQGKYLALNSQPETAGKHSGLFWALSQACQVCGGIFLLIVFLLHQHSNPEEHYHFGSNFAPSTVKLLYAVFTGITVLGALILGLLPLNGENVGNNRRRHGEDSPSPSELLDPIINPISNQPTGEANILDNGNGTDNEPNKILTSILSMIKSTFILAKTSKMLLLSIPFMYTGIVVSFWSSIYPTSIANTELFQLNQGVDPKILLALNAIIQGVGQSSAGLLFGIFGVRTTKILTKSNIVLIGALLQLLAYFAIFASIPGDASLGKTLEEGYLIYPRIWIALLSGFLIGFGDSCWNTQIFSLLISHYSQHQSASAFSLFKFYQSLLTFLAFLYASLLSLYWHLLFLFVGSILALFSFIFVERTSQQTTNNVDISEEQQHDIN